jgi:beta-glucosidase
MRTSLSLFLLAASMAGAVAAQTTVLPYQDPSLSPQQRALDLVSRMTLEEKAAQSINNAPAIPRLGVPAYNWWSEGLHGVARSGYATLFPQAISNAATFDAPLLHEIGIVVSTEARAKYNEAARHGIHSIYYGLTIWSPNINIFRDPRWGRGQETYGEDPFLTATLGTTFIRGLQGDDPRFFRVIATPKHFAVHSGPESTRHQADIDPTPHDLYDTYLPQFRAAIVDGHADSIMCAYNSLYGKPACASNLLLGDLLRKDWGFHGFVTSDCDAVADFVGEKQHNYSPDKAHAAALGILAGTDTDCGEVGNGDTYLALPEAVRLGLLKESDLNGTLTRLFEARIRLGLFDPPASVPYASLPFSEVNSPAHQATALRAARESIVLLKNANGTLPLSPRIRTLAVVGPNTADLSSIEGNYNAVAKNPMLPLAGIERQFPHTRVLYAQGASFADGLSAPLPQSQLHPSAAAQEHGLKAEYFANDHFDGKPVVTRVDPQIDFDWNSAAPVAGTDSTAFSVRWSGTLSVPVPGDYPLSVRFAHCHPCHDMEGVTLTVDGKELLSFKTKEADADRSSSVGPVTLHLEDSKPHAFKLAYSHSAKLFGGGLTLSWTAPSSVLLEQARSTVASADAIVAFVGLSPELEGEEMPVHTPGFSGGDRTDIQLPAAQQALLEAMAATGKPLIVVSLSGSALAYNWANEHASAIVQAWYPGQAGAQAIAETLSGKNNPGGRLPVTFYTGIAELPSFDDYSMKQRTYRYFSGSPLYRFGYGLSYTTFRYSDVKLSTATLHAGDSLQAEADVTNTGSRLGDEVAELYLIPPANGNGGISPRLQLEGFQRVPIAPGQTKHLHFVLSARELSEVNDKGIRSVQPGAYRLAIGGAQPADTMAPAASQSASFQIEGQFELPR